MRNTPTLTELVRDAALDNDFGVDRLLVLLLRLKHVYGSDPATHKALDEMADILIGIQARSRTIHQTAERQGTVERQDDAKRRLTEEDEAQVARMAQFL